MHTKTKQGKNKKDEHSFFEVVTEVFGWLQIVASPLLAGLVIGFIIYLSISNNFGILAGVSVTLIGLIAGIIWATKVWKEKGTIHFMSRVRATSELDKKEQEQE